MKQGITKKITAPRVQNVRCKTEAECKAIGDTLRDSYAKGKRFRKVGFSKAKSKSNEDN